MFSHVMVGVNNMEKSKAFYDATMKILGHPEGIMDEKGRCFYVTPTGVFALTVPINGEPATHGNGYTTGFNVDSPELIDKWHEVGLAHGGSLCEEPPGIREGVTAKLYLAYLLDPAGNKMCALHRVK